MDRLEPSMLRSRPNIMSHANVNRPPFVVAVAVVLTVSACGGSGATNDATTTTAATVTTSTTRVTTNTVESTTTADNPTTTLPGEPIDIGPQAGDVLAVIGVAHNDVLNLRAAPGVDQEILAELDPLADDVIALGNARALPQSIWYELEAGGVIGWANSSFLGYLGQTTDETSAIIDALGETPRAETMLDLGMIVAEALASDEPASRIIMSVAPSVGDLGEVTYDVVGIGDDSVRGFRLHVFGTPDEGGEGFVLKSVEQTLLCGRGLSNGICV
jgi:hypothetical protein